MRYILILWFVPLALFWGWYGLSANDIHFGSIYFSRLFHDHMFSIYGNILGVEPELVPGMIAGAFAFDSLVLLAFVAFRWRKDWYPQTKAWVLEKLGYETEREEAGEHTAPVINSSLKLTDPMHPAE